MLLHVAEITNYSGRRTNQELQVSGISTHKGTTISTELPSSCSTFRSALQWMPME